MGFAKCCGKLIGSYNIVLSELVKIRTIVTVILIALFKVFLENTFRNEFIFFTNVHVVMVLGGLIYTVLTDCKS